MPLKSVRRDLKLDLKFKIEKKWKKDEKNFFFFVWHHLFYKFLGGFWDGQIRK